MSSGEPAWERYRDASGAYTSTGEGDTAGFWFSFRSTDPGPLNQPYFPAGTGEFSAPA